MPSHSLFFYMSIDTSNMEEKMERKSSHPKRYDEHFICNIHDRFGRRIYNLGHIYLKDWPKTRKYLDKFDETSLVFSIIVGSILGDSGHDEDYANINKLVNKEMSGISQTDVRCMGKRIRFEYDFVMKSFFSLMNRFLTYEGDWGSGSFLDEKKIYNGLVGLKREIDEALNLVRSDRESNIVTNCKTFEFIRSSILSRSADADNENDTADLLLVLGFATVIVLVKHLVIRFNRNLLIWDMDEIKEMVETNLRSLFNEIAKTDLFNSLFGELIQLHKTVNYAIIKGLEEHLEAFGNIDLSDVVDENGHVLIYVKDPRLVQMSNAIRFDNSFMEQLATYKKEENFISRKWITSNETLEEYIKQLSARLYFFDENEFKAYVEKYKSTICGDSLNDENAYRSNMVLLASDYVSTKATYEIYRSITGKMRESLYIKKNSSELDFFYVYFVKPLIYSDCGRCIDRIFRIYDKITFDTEFGLSDLDSFPSFLDEFGMGGSPSYSVFQEEFSKALKRFKEVL